MSGQLYRGCCTYPVISSPTLYRSPGPRPPRPAPCATINSRSDRTARAKGVRDLSRPTGRRVYVININYRTAGGTQTEMHLRGWCERGRGAEKKRPILRGGNEAERRAITIGAKHPFCRPEDPKKYEVGVGLGVLCVLDPKNRLSSAFDFT